MSHSARVSPRELDQHWGDSETHPSTCLVSHRHGDRCSRLHTKPTISQTVLLVNIYQSPELTAANDPVAQAALEPRKLQEHFEVRPSPPSAHTRTQTHTRTSLRPTTRVRCRGQWWLRNVESVGERIGGNRGSRRDWPAEVLLVSRRNAADLRRLEARRALFSKGAGTAVVVGAARSAVGALPTKVTGTRCPYRPSG